MTILRVTVTIPRDTGIPEDAVSNTFHFNTSGALAPGDAAEAAGRIANLYLTNGGGGGLGAHLGKQLNGAGATYKVWNLSDPEPRIPIAQGNFPITTIGTGDAMVAEVAIVIAFHAAYVSGTPNARRRGRIFLGPLAISNQGFLNNDPVVDSGSRADLALCFEDLIAEDTADMKFSVYSPTTHTAHAPVVGGWIDNAFDTQRRRGIRPTQRTNILAG